MATYKIDPTFTDGALNPSVHVVVGGAGVQGHRYVCEAPDFSMDHMTSPEVPEAARTALRAQIDALVAERGIWSPPPE